MNKVHTNAPVCILTKDFGCTDNNHQSVRIADENHTLCAHHPIHEDKCDQCGQITFIGTDVEGWGLYTLSYSPCEHATDVQDAVKDDLAGK